MGVPVRVLYRYRPVSPVLGLEVLMRVPVGVEDDDRVGRLEVESEAARPRGQQEDEVVGAGLVELGQHVAPVLGFCRAVQPE
jgi:hypothetical protein